MRKRIAIDMNQVLADTLSHHFAIYNAEHEEKPTRDDLKGRRLYAYGGQGSRLPNKHGHSQNAPCSQSAQAASTIR